MITTKSGKIIDLFNLTVDDLEIEDVIIALPNICRFGGRIHTHYSVAQHAVELSRYLHKINKEYLAPIALLHDACESYIGDMIYPLKVQFPEFVKLEERISNLFFTKYNVDRNLFEEFNYYDRNIVVNEMKAVGLYELDKELITHLDGLSDLEITPWSRDKAKAEFCCELIKVFGLKTYDKV